MKIFNTLIYLVLGITLPNATFCQSLAELAKMAGIDLKELGAEHMLSSPSSSSSMSPFGSYSPLSSSASSSSPSCSNCGKSGCPGCQEAKSSYATASSNSNGYSSYPMSSVMNSYPSYPDANGYGNLGGGVEALSALSSVYSPSMNGFGGQFGGYGSPEANFMPAAAYSSPMMSQFMSSGMGGGYESGPSSYGQFESSEPAAPQEAGKGEGEDSEYQARPRPRRPAPPSNGNEDENNNESERYNSRPGGSNYYRSPDAEQNHGPSAAPNGDYENSPSTRQYAPRPLNFHTRHQLRGSNYNFE